MRGGRALAWFLSGLALFFFVAVLAESVWQVLPAKEPGWMRVGALFLHALNSILLYGVGRGLRLPGVGCLFAAVIHLTFFGHFHAILCRTEIQHLAVSGTILAILAVYLGTERLRRQGRPSRSLPSRLPAGWVVSLWLWAVPILWGIALLRGDRRQILFPYNLFVPWVTCVTSWTDPIRTALTMDNTEPLCRIPALIGPGALILSAGLLALFWRIFVRGRPARGMLFIWYLLAAAYPVFHDISHPIQVPSRYLIYLSPIFALITGSLLASFGSLLLRRAGARAGRRGAWLSAALLLLSMTNLCAVRIGLWRGRLANGYFTYDDLRGAGLPVVQWGSLPPTARPSTADPFTGAFEKGMERLRAGDWLAARSALSEAANRRPYLLRFLLPRPLRLSDARFLTGGKGLRRWLWGLGHDRRLIDSELAQYAACFLSLSYLSDRLGDAEGKKAWLSQMRFIESDPAVVVDWLGAQVAASGAEWVRFLREVQDPALFRDPLPWRKEDYGIGRFLIRLILHRDLKSGWDREQRVMA